MMKKKKILLLTIGLCFLFSSLSNAATPTGSEFFGIGLQLGDPSAATMKLMPSPKLGIQFHVGGGSWKWHRDWGNLFVTGLDVVVHPMIYDKWKTCSLTLTLGGGIAGGIFRGWWRDRYDRDRYYYDRYYYYNQHYGIMFLRMVTGLSLWFKKFPLETFIEINPAIRIFNPDPIGFHMFWTGAGARWYF